jgi:CRP-like cAMP-binding protein
MGKNLINRDGDGSKRDGASSRKAVPGVDGHLKHNKILLGLPAKEAEMVFVLLEFVELPIHTILHDVSDPIKFAYFINEGLASIVNVMSDGKSVEVGLTGKEGFTGTPLMAGLRSSSTRAVTQIAGNAFRIKSAELVALLPDCPKLEMALNRFVQELAMQSSQVAACNRLHEVEERLARWLLMCQDRIGGDQVPLTQEFLAHMLGTRRASVTVAAGILQKAGLITYHRGHVKIESRASLEAAVCECYGAMALQLATWQKETKADSKSDSVRQRADARIFDS